jgi:predicted ATPase
MGKSLRLAVSLGNSLAQLHARGLIHKDIKPANILVDPTNDRVRLTGFGVATRLPREHQSPEPPELIAGTLSHMAPEQTGRMNRSVDSRSDLYSFGVTLYQVLTGSLPFMASDPMEWVHCHIARKPTPLEERFRDIPSQVSAIVMKLLAKTPEERYQTAAGATRDLQRCLADWESQRTIDQFPLGEQDRPDRLRIPERLYGRHNEINTLLASFDDVVATGTPQLVVVCGAPGVGKSSVVNELHKVLVPPQGLFASGKFDQLKPDIPYATLAQAFGGLMRYLLGKPEAELSKWRHDLRQALDPNGALVVDLIPELKFIIGEQPAVPDLSPQDTKARFQLALRRLIGVFARPEHPLALFLDDLQWLDAGTLDLLEDLLVQPDLQHLLLVGAYRDNEVNATHPLMLKLAAIREGGARVQEIALTPLKQEDLAQLIADALHCQPQQAMPLAQLVHEKTAGNPFFANQFIQELAEEELIRFDSGAVSWLWELYPIQQKGYSDNVVDLMTAKLSRLPLPTQQVLQELACLGNRADTSTFSLIYGRSQEELILICGRRIRLDLIVWADASIQFAHDRVQEAAYSLIAEELRASAHLRIGRLLLKHTPEDKSEEAVFEIVGQLNRGAVLMTSQDEREQLAEFNLRAGKRAKAATAYTSALSYLTAGSALVGEDGWNRCHELVFELGALRAECEFFTGGFASAEARLTALSSHAGSVVEQAHITRLLYDVHYAGNRHDLCIAECLRFLRHVQIDVPTQPTEAQAQAAYEQVWSKLGNRSIEELLNLPLMVDPASRATLDVIAKFAISSLSTDKNLFVVVVCAGVNFSLERGNTDSSCYLYANFGVIAGWHFGNFDAGFRFGQLGLEVTERQGLRRHESLVRLVLAGQIMPWSRHVENCHDLIRNSFELARKSGDRIATLSTWGMIIEYSLFAGDPLVEVENEAEVSLEHYRRAMFQDFIHLGEAQTAFIRNLRGLTRQFGSLDDERFSETYHQTQPQVPTFECFYWLRKLQARYLAADYTEAMDASNHVERLQSSAPALLEIADYRFYSALTHAALCGDAADDERQEHFMALADHLKSIENWARHCPENFENRVALVAAEIARLEDRNEDAMRLYEQAIRSAGENRFVHNEALALELAACFYEGRGFYRIARTYIQDARNGYLQWGADGKARQLEERYPDLTAKHPHPDSTYTVQTPVDQLDLAAVLQVLQAVSSETNLEKLISIIMRVSLEQAGAQRGLLILPRGDGFGIEAESQVLMTM